ncbi:hypothetical protein ACFS27_16965 [Promicromonospora vindobonensis]|uniref:Uncharacterized protein n=1 Tax=Promicromonospora vindobonensis TaxID=195748 RepID=A0ABW5VUD7_9MICO
MTEAISHTRAWGCGVAFLYDPVHGDIVDTDPDVPVTTSPTGLDIKVRHAQDYGWANGEEGPAVTTMHIARPGEDAPPHRAVVVRAVVVEATLETRGEGSGHAAGRLPLRPAPAWVRGGHSLSRRANQVPGGGTF